MARRDRRRATSGALAASALFHLVLFAVLAYQAVPIFRAPPEAAPDFELQLVNAPAFVPARPAPRQSRRHPPVAQPRTRAEPRPIPRPPSRAIPPPPRPAPPRPPPVRPPAASAAPPSRTTASIPAPGGPSAASRGAGAEASAGHWTVEGEDDQDGVRKFLRATVGCSHQDYLRLNEQERAACDRRIGEDARAFGIPPDKLAGFIAAAEAQERGRAERGGPPIDPVLPCQGIGSNLDRGCLNLPEKHPQP